MNPSRWLAQALIGILFLTLCVAPATSAETVTVYRDEFGVPHIYADTVAGAAFGAGYAQAEDRLEAILRNYRGAGGTMSEAFGEEFFRHDYRQRMWQHERMSRQKFGELDPRVQRACRAYVAGVQKFMAEHPEQVPDWAQPLHGYEPVMLYRYIIWGWPEGQAAGDLRRGGIEPDPIAYRGSNEWLITPSRTQLGAVIACIDPHLSWYGEFRFYEERLYAENENFAVSGAAIIGAPFPGLGHNQYVSIAKTTGGPDTSDVYEETVHKDDPAKYEFDGRWRDMKTLTETIRIKTESGFDEREVAYQYTHHGPVVARRDGKAYTMALPYFEQVWAVDELYGILTSKNLADVKSALSKRQLMPQNLMIGTAGGDIFYVRFGRVPIRNHDQPLDRPIPGNTSKYEWAGIHPFEDLVQIENPPQGYMQNCNISPAVMMKQSPLQPDRYERFYLYQSNAGPAHQRAQMVTEILHANSAFTLEDAFDLAFNTQVYKAELWQRRIEKAWTDASIDRKADDTKAVYEAIQSWNCKSDADSVGAYAFYLFKMALGDDARSVDVPEVLTDAGVLDALLSAAQTMRRKHGRLDIAYGDVFRVGRTGSDETWPVGGGSVRQAGMATPRAIGFRERGKFFVGQGGQTSTQIVVLTSPPKSYMVLPLGESDHPDSPHFDDQAERLFSHGRAKDTFFMDRERLLPNVTRTTELEFVGAAASGP